MREAGPDPGGGRWWWAAAIVVVAHPSLYVVAVRQVVRLAPSGWWRRWPPVPRPDPAYLRFRLQTAYGDTAQAPDPDDVLAYLWWCRARHRSGR